jgi:hypothetical protein
MVDKWKGVIVAEGLLEPSLINGFEVFRARISKTELDVGDGKTSRWHIYHVYATETQICEMSTQIRPGWYAHFWKGDSLQVIFRDRKFRVQIHDKSTWKPPIEYGRSIGIPEKELDFPTD